MEYYKIESNCSYFNAYQQNPTYSEQRKCSNYLGRCDAAESEGDLWKYHKSLNNPNTLVKCQCSIMKF